MWILRELLRLFLQIAVAIAIAGGIAALWALLSSGDLVRDLRFSFLIIGCLLLLFAGAGNRSTASGRRMDYGIVFGLRSSVGRLSPALRPRPGEPTLTASAVFVGSAIVLIALGLIV